MLVPVAQHQSRFVVPGLTPDARGVAAGKQAVLLLPSLDRAVAALRMLAAGAAVEELLARLEVQRVRSDLGAVEFVARFPAAEGHLLDRASQVAGLHGGELLTGDGRHFVRYRDRHSPLGYDVDRLAAPEPEDRAALVLYGRVTEGGYRVEETFPLARLLLRLAPAPARRPPPLPDPALLLVPRGLRPPVESLLRRRDVDAEVARTAGDAEAFLYRLRGAPPPTLRLLARTPGLTLYAEEGERAAVEHGFEHPFDLVACAGALEEGRLFLFRGGRPGATVLEGPPQWLPLREGAHPEVAAELRPLRTVAPGPPAVIPLRLVSAPGASGPAEALLVPRRQLTVLRALVHRLPAAALEQLRAASLDEGVLLVGDGPVEDLPLGTPLQRGGEGVYVPVGTAFLPRVPPEVVAEALDAGAGRLVFFTARDAAPFAVAEADLVPLTRAFLARLDVPRRAVAAVPAELAAPSVHYAERRLLPSWGRRLPEGGGEE